MESIIKNAFKKAKEIVNDSEIHVFRDSYDAYYMVIVRQASCKDKSKIIDKIYDEVYKTVDQIDLTIYIFTEEAYKIFLEENKKYLEEVKIN